MKKQHPNDEIVKSLMDNMSYEIILIFPGTEVQKSLCLNQMTIILLK